MAFRPKGSALQLARQQADVGVQFGVQRPQLLDLPHRVDHRRMVAPAEAPADLGQRARGELLGQVHRDLPRHRVSGLRHALGLLRDVEGVSITHFTARDVVRHPLVQRIVEAYERDDAKREPARREDAKPADGTPSNDTGQRT